MSRKTTKKQNQGSKGRLKKMKIYKFVIPLLPSVKHMYDTFSKKLYFNLRRIIKKNTMSVATMRQYLKRAYLSPCILVQRAYLRLCPEKLKKRLQVVKFKPFTA